MYRLSAKVGTRRVTRERLMPLAAAAATGVLVGSGIVATRFAVAEAGPASLALLRYAIGFCCILPVALMGPRVRFARRDLLPIALLGIAQFGILVALLNLALEYIPSARAALLFATMPLMTLCLAAAKRQERMTLGTILGVLLTIAGVGFALGEKLARPAGGAGAWLGELAALGSAFSGALCSVLYRPYLRRYPTLTVSAFAMLASVAFLALLAAGEGFFAAAPRFTTGGWLAVLFIGANSGVGYVLWLWALNHAPATHVTMFLALSPVTAALLGAAFLGERLSFLALLGLACVALGLWLAQRRAPNAAPG